MNSSGTISSIEHVRTLQEHLYTVHILRNSLSLIYAAMRLRDKLAAVRVQAVKAVQRLQDPTGFV